MQLKQGTLWGANGGVALDDALRCTEYLNSRGQKKKREGKEKHPFRVNTGSMFANEVTGHHLTPAAELQLERTKIGDVTTSVAGTRDHYDFSFTAPGELQMRWLSCVCTGCAKRKFETCVNKHMVGKRVERTVEVSATAGVAARTAQQKLTWQQLADKLEQGDVVAAFSDQDEAYPRVKYWLGTVIRVRQAAKEGEHCPALKDSGPLFKGPRGDSPADVVVELTWLERSSIREEDDLNFKAVSNEVHLIHASTLRLGPLILTTPEPGQQQARTRNSHRSAVRELSAAQHQDIVAAQLMYED